MPAFILDHGSPAASRSLNACDEFTQGYIEAMFFTETGSGDDEEMEHSSVADLADETWQTIIVDCNTFQREQEALLECAVSHPEVSYSLEQAGHDFWFTRNGHGVGFWDRDLGEVGDRLSDACRHTEIDLYMGDDGQLYLM